MVSFHCLPVNFPPPIPFLQSTRTPNLSMSSCTIRTSTVCCCTSLISLNAFYIDLIRFLQLSCQALVFIFASRYPKCQTRRMLNNRITTIPTKVFTHLIRMVTKIRVYTRHMTCSVCIHFSRI